MSKLANFSRRVEKISDIVAPRPLVINCTGAKEELLATLEASMTEEERNTPYVPTPEQEIEMAEFDAFMADRIARDEQEFNVRYISYE